MTGVSGPSGIRTYRWAEFAQQLADRRGHRCGRCGRGGEQLRPATPRHPAAVAVRPDHPVRVPAGPGDRRLRRGRIPVEHVDRRRSGPADRCRRRQRAPPVDQLRPAGNPVLVTERDGATTVHEYDQRGRKVRTVTPTGADLTWGYDEPIGSPPSSPKPARSPSSAMTASSGTPRPSRPRRRGHPARLAGWPARAGDRPDRCGRSATATTSTATWSPSLMPTATRPGWNATSWVGWLPRSRRPGAAPPTLRRDSRSARVTDQPGRRHLVLRIHHRRPADRHRRPDGRADHRRARAAR